MTGMLETRDGRVRFGLLLLRIATGLFFLVWSLDKIFNSKHTLAVFEKFYMTPISDQIAIGLGVVQTAIVLAFLAGLYKKWTTLALLAMHTVSVGSTWSHLINPYGEQSFGLVFWAAVPVWAGLLLLWLMRDEDTLMSVH